MNKYISAFWQRKIAQFEPCPLPRSLGLLEGGKVLVVAPHPDDEILGCGGTLALLRQRACQIKVVIVTDGGAGDPLNYTGGDVVNVRQQEAIAALGTLRITDLVFLNEQDGCFRASSSFSEKMSSIIREFQPDWLFLPSILDYHRDHAAIGLSVVNSWEKSGCSGRAFFYEIWAPLPADTVVDITQVLDEKRKAVSCYALPMKYRDYREAMLGLAAYRGLYLPSSGQSLYAEAFLELKRKRLNVILSALMRLRFLLELRLSHTK